MPRTFVDACSTISQDEPLANWWEQFEDPTLNKLINYALDCNYGLLVALEKIEEARALYRFKERQLFPQVDAVGEARRTRFSQATQQTSFLTDNRLSSFNLGLDAFWEIDIWGRLRHARNAQLYAFQAQVEQMYDVVIMLIAEVARTYVRLCTLNKKLDLTHNKEQIEQRLVILQKDLYISGLTSNIIVAEQEQILATTRNSLEQLKIAHAQTYHQLAVLLGLNPEQFRIKNPRNNVPLSDYPINTGIPSDLLRRRPDIRQAERLIISANESVRSAMAEWFPQFTLFGGADTRVNQANNLFRNNSFGWFIGPSFSWPILDFGRIAANIDVQKSIKKQNILQYKQTIISALKDVEDFLIAYCHTKEQRALLDEKYAYACEQETLINTKYTAGLVNELNYLNAQRNSITVALQVTDIQQIYSNSLIGLYKALGGGW
jgi:multidrug efflux system outer membrane protein